MPEMGAAKLKEIYTNMVKIRFFEERAITEYRKGLPGFVHPSIGQEAIPAGVCACLREDDYTITTHRGHGDIIAKGAQLDRMMAELFARKDGYCKGKGGSMHIADVSRNILGATGIVGDGLPIAAGVGAALKMQGKDTIMVAFFGDGSTNSGAFHEGIGLAAAWSLPVLFVCQNNQYQQSTPTRDYTRLTDIADRAKGYGIPGISVDGNDAIAVAEVAREAIEKCRKGEGPIFIVANTYRTVGHHMGDPGTSYRPKEEVEEWKKKDPIKRLRKQMVQNKMATDAELDEIEQNVLRELDEAVKFAQESPMPAPEEALEDIYA
jgi:pyruvate dehydrogenase E1 component alpha subunit